MGIIKNGQKNLENLGVVSESVKLFIEKIEKLGGVAKICGAGGRTKGCGIILVYATDKKKIEELNKSAGFEFINLFLGAEGVREEKLTS